MRWVVGQGGNESITTTEDNHAFIQRSAPLTYRVVPPPSPEHRNRCEAEIKAFYFS